METIETEEIIMKLISYGGDAKSSALKAIDLSMDGKFEEAEEMLKRADKSLMYAHEFQTGLLQKECDAELKGNDNGVRVSLMLVHGQDHLMNAMTTRDLAEKIIKLNRRLMKEEMK